MSYHVYTTQGIVISGKALGDADKYYHIFTKELGLILASAKSVRKPESKLRYALDDFCISELSFVRGKHYWKITSARDILNIFKTLSLDHSKRNILVRALNLTKQLLQGEEKNEQLFNLLSGAHNFLHTTTLTGEELVAFECVLSLRILSSLGYVKNEEVYSSFIETSVWSSFLLHDAVPYIAKMTSQINASIEASQL
jgi:DNA repair protein RecO